MSEQPTDPVHVSPRRARTIIALGLGVLVLDLATKILAVRFLEDREPVRVLGGLLYLTLHRNPGAAFSMATNLTWLLSAVTLLVAVAIVVASRRIRSLPWAIGLGAILGGALGNLVDRVFREPGGFQGHVVDFLSLLAPDGSVWPVFNVADPAIVGGAILLVLLTVIGVEPDGTRHRSSKAVPAKAATGKTVQEKPAQEKWAQGEDA
ncbi:signal peptidase II [Lolliginicoccus levis]|uniref:signal peptidase II n=1 Tax=Lolliginicoccus levis TaxID=2919542 RepID=UPI00241C2DCF|nr:signal peptidase II [Lolliginicoccus levis]